MARIDALSPTEIVKVGLMALVAFAVFRFIANLTGSQTLASRIPS